MTPARLRHPDHRWEWDRAQFGAWADATAAAYGYDVRLEGIGPDDPEHGAPTQLALFTRSGATSDGAASDGAASNSNTRNGTAP